MRLRLYSTIIAYYTSLITMLSKITIQRVILTLQTKFLPDAEIVVSQKLHDFLVSSRLQLIRKSYLLYVLSHFEL